MEFGPKNPHQNSQFSNIEELDAEDESESEIGAEGNLYSKIAKLTSSKKYEMASSSGGDSIRSYQSSINNLDTMIIRDPSEQEKNELRCIAEKSVLEADEN
jgi:hypothetical protein